MSQFRKHVTAKTWEYNDNFQFPENEYINPNKKNFGIAFSGGGNRSAALTIGYLRALQNLDLIKNVKYFSCVSGGSWAIIPYIFLDKSISDDVFLGEMKKPEELKLEEIQQAHKRSFVNTISNTVLLDDLFKSGFVGDERFAYILNNLFLKPNIIGDRTKFFSLNQKTVDVIINRPGNNDLRKSNFYIAQETRPYLISNGVLTRSSAVKINRYPFEMTPLYVGVPSYFKDQGSIKKYSIGGGYVEPFGFDSDNPDDGIDDQGFAKVRIKRERNIFSLADVMATTGAALAEHLDRALLRMGFPEFKYWSPKKPKDSVKDYDFADGGLMDNSGVIALLRRKVEKIVVFVNGSSNLNSFDEHGNDEVSTMVKTLFMEVKSHWGKRKYDWNKILEEPGMTGKGKESYENLRKEFMALNKNNKPAVVQKKYVTIKNERFDIPEGHEVEILWVHNALVYEWFEKIKDPELKEYIDYQCQEKDFPCIKTFYANRGRMIDLDIPQTHLMTHHASYIVDSLKQQFIDFLS